jgi:phage-related protein
MDDKSIYWLGSSKSDLSRFPAEVRRDAGFQLRALQQRLTPIDFKPISTVGKGVEEIRLRSEDGAYRVFYVARFEEAIYILHAFQKKTQKTAKRDIQLGQQRYQAMLRLRQQ